MAQLGGVEDMFPSLGEITATLRNFEYTRPLKRFDDIGFKMIF